MAAEAAEAAYLAATAPGEADEWAPPLAADALLMRGRLALLDGKLRVSVRDLGYMYCQWRERPCSREQVLVGHAV